jgi:pyridoxine 4-dehydrogenase
MDAELQQVFDLCVRQGINFFDTAEVYGLGRSEYLCGKFKREFQGPQVPFTTLQLALSFVLPCTSDS